MAEPLSQIYENHHSKHSRCGFSILEDKRGEIFSTTVGTNKKILDIGCRDGTLTRYFAKNNNVVGIDIDTIALKKAQETLNIKTEVIDLNGNWDAVAKYGPFDAITAGEILEHLYFPETVIKKCVNLLINNGVLLISVPNAFSLINRVRYFLGHKKNTPLEDPTHINHFSATELKTILKKFFVNVEIKGLGRHKKLAALFPSLFAFDLVFVCNTTKQN